MLTSKLILHSPGLLLGPRHLCGLRLLWEHVSSEDLAVCSQKIPVPIHSAQAHFEDLPGLFQRTAGVAGVCTPGLRDKGQLWGWMLLTLTSKGVLTCVLGPCPEESPGWECGPGLPGHYCAPSQALQRVRGIYIHSLASRLLCLGGKIGHILFKGVLAGFIT